MDSTFQERNWDLLLDDIESGQVIPVVGPDLASVELDGVNGSVYHHVARTLVQDFGLDESKLPDGYMPSHVASWASETPTYDRKFFYNKVRRIMRGKQWPIPEALLQLAKISHFDLFISTTFDDLMQRALGEVRSEEVVSLAYSSLQESVVDIDPDVTKNVVFQIFGELSHPPDYVLTEEDQLRFTHLLQIHDRQPENLFDLARERRLMAVGCSLPNWLARFFLYSAKGDNVFQGRLESLFAGDVYREDVNFAMFVNRGKGEIYDAGNAVNFVGELYRRWTERFGEPDVTSAPVQTPQSLKIAPAPAEEAAPEPKVVEKAAELREEEIPEFIKGSVFLSYASENVAEAAEIKELLEEVGIDVWFDKRRLEAGDSYERKIHQNIKKSSVFVAVLSKHTLTPDRRFFRVEWNMAFDERRYRPTSRQFVVPVIVDDTAIDQEPMLSEFSTLHGVRLLNSEAIQEFQASMVKAVRSVRRQRA